MKTPSKMKMTSKMKTTSKIKTTSQMKTTPKMKITSKMMTTSKMNTTLKIGPPLQIFILSPSPWKHYLKFLLMTSHLDSHTTTDVKPEMIPGVLTRNGTPHDKCNIGGIAHARTIRKDDIFMQRRMYVDKLHTALDIFCFAVFLLIIS